MENNIKAIRVEKGISQTKLANDAGVSRQTINRIENLEKVDLKVNTLVNIADALGVSIDAIFLPSVSHK